MQLLSSQDMISIALRKDKAAFIIYNLKNSHIPKITTLSQS